MSGKKPVVIFLVAALALTTTAGCAGWLSDVPTIEPLPTLTPSVTSPPDSIASAGSLTPFTPSPTATVTLTPTPAELPLQPTATPRPGQEQTAPAPPSGAVPPPEILYFVAFPEQVEPGQSVLLFWSSEGGTSAAVYRLNADGTPGQTWAVATEGSLTVTPRATGHNEVYVLAVTNGLTTVEQPVYIATICTQAWFFAPPPEEGCPDGPARSTQAVTQTFERGRMFWLAETDEIIVLFDDLPPLSDLLEEGEGEDRPPAWISLPDPYVEGEPEIDETIQPPEGFTQPRRGFGTVWRTVPDVRDRLGWALGEERGYEMLFQSETIGEERQLYFTDDLGAVIRLVPGGEGWLVIAYQQ
ncbi:MAG TPA: hypothetical protein ENI95_03400 [Chloroflexi bacterium]|nr:hypothetical protein [Chloroflexota bacterium]